MVAAPAIYNFEDFISISVNNQDVHLIVSNDKLTFTAGKIYMRGDFFDLSKSAGRPRP